MAIQSIERPSRGFTLVELLIAMAMIGLITLVLFSGLRLGSRAWETVETVSNRTNDLRLADGFLVRVLSEIRPAKTVIEAEEVNIFGGDAARLEFAAPLSEHVGLAGLYALRLTLEEQDSTQALVVTRWFLHPEVMEGGDDFPPWEPLEKDKTMSLDEFPADMDAADGAFGRTLLLEGVRELEIAYFGLADGDSDPDWHEDWLGQSRMPDLVRLRIAAKNQSWPDIYVRLPSDQQ